MKKILLVIEDYNENHRLQVVLKKVGFDVLSMPSMVGLVDKVLGFNPDIIVSHGIQKFTSIGLAQKLKEMPHLKAKCVVVLPNGEKLNASELMKIKMDILMEAPIMPQKLIEVISKLFNLDANPILEKLKKAQLVDQMLGIIKPGVHSDKITDSSRSQKYQKFVSELPPINKKETTFKKAELKAKQEEMEKEWDTQLTDSINDLKKQFVEALYKKK